MTKHSGPKAGGVPAATLIDNRIAQLGDWRAETLSQVRALLKETVPDVLEEWKWMGTPVWSSSGIICTGESYKKVVKLTFAKGASLQDPSGLFNSSMDGNVRRAIDIQQGEKINVRALSALIREAVALNVSGKKASPKKTAPNQAAKAATKKAATKKAATKKAAPAKSVKKPAPAKR